MPVLKILTYIIGLAVIQAVMSAWSFITDVILLVYKIGVDTMMDFNLLHPCIAHSHYTEETQAFDLTRK